MSTLKRGAIVLSLVEALREHNSWCGETSIQKATYFLKEALKVPLDYTFVLYKYGPYSFQLTDDLTALRADGVLDLELRDPRYAPSYFPGRMSKFIHKRMPNTIARYEKQIDFVARKLGEMNITELEKIATALYVLQENHRKSSKGEAHRICDLKPHISLLEARAAINQVRKFVEEAAPVALN